MCWRDAVGCEHSVYAARDARESNRKREKRRCAAVERAAEEAARKAKVSAAAVCARGRRTAAPRTRLVLLLPRSPLRPLPRAVSVQVQKFLDTEKAREGHILKLLQAAQVRRPEYFKCK